MRIKIHSFKWLLFLLTLFLGMMYVMRRTGGIVGELSGGQGILDLTFAVSPQAAGEALARYSRRGAMFYRYAFLSVDLVYALVYCTFYRSAIGYVCEMLSAGEKTVKILGALPVVGMAGDIIENNILFILLSPGGGGEWLYLPLMVFNIIKFVFVYISLAVVLGGMLCLIKKRLS